MNQELARSNVNEKRVHRHITRSIYFAAADGGPVKIGMSCDPRRRLRELRTKTGSDLKLLATVPTFSVGSFMEYRYHSRFAAHRLEGEWFTRHPDILAEIARLNGEVA